MASTSHFHLFPSADVAPAAPMQTFDLFPALSAPLRIKIWRLALERQRIIKSREDEDYGAVVEGYQTLSKLFRVSAESREAAMAFYRVHLPCWLIKGATRSGAMKPGILYFNPEHDFLHISNDTGHVADFLHDLKTIHDPRKIGLLNLAADMNALNAGGGFCTIDPSGLDPRRRASFTETVAQLREVFFVQVQKVGRYIHGWASGAPTEECRRNPSFPITARALNFDRLQTDPRPIGQDLGNVLVNADPRRMLYAWRRFLYNYFGGRVLSRTQYRVLLAFYPTSPHGLYDRGDAEEWLQKAEDSWVKDPGPSGQVPNEPEGSQAAVKSAFGFWLFPVQAFGALPENPNDPFRSEAPRYMDLNDHWPELALLSLP